MADAEVEIQVNGRPTRVPDGASVDVLLRELGLGEAACAVEVNRSLVPKRLHAEHRLAAGDVVEVVTLVGGG